MDKEGRLEPRTPPVAPFVYTGVGILKPQLFDGVKGRRVQPCAVLLARGRAGPAVWARLDGLWLHVGRPETIAEAEAAIDRSIL